MKTGKIASLAIAVLAVVISGGAAYSYLGGADPSRNMGSYRSFSFYADLPGNAAAGWFQPGAALLAHRMSSGSTIRAISTCQGALTRPVP